MDPEDFYQPGSRLLQERFGTRKLAAHLAHRYVLGELDEQHTGWIRAADAVWVATVSPAGQPECSYKGGLPGFVHVAHPRLLEVPSYDGNGMYRTLGNATTGARVGLLFLFPAVPAKLRVNGVCEVSTEPAVLAGHHGAEAVLRVHVEHVFENCPRYLHNPASGEHSADCPRPGHRPPQAAWKQKPEYEQLLPGRPAAAEVEHS